MLASGPVLMILLDMMAQSSIYLIKNLNSFA
jgi:hypothetical protein